MPINPLTGLETDPKKKDSKKEKVINPLTGLEMTPVEPYEPSFVNLPQYNSEPISNYSKYGVVTRPGFDWNEDRARRQPKIEKWGHGSAKALATTAGAVAENTAGFVVGIGSALINRDLSKLYDNPVGRAVDKMNKGMQEAFPNYYTQEEREATGFGSIGYANFWADKFLNGVGYAGASIATIYATGGAGLITRGARAATSKNLYRMSKALAQGDDVGAALEGVGKVARGVKSLNATQQLEMGMMMAMGESSVEAREILHTATENLTQQRADELGVEPSQLSSADMQDIRERAASIANVGYALNMAIVGYTNFKTMGQVFMPKFMSVKQSAGAGALKGITRNKNTGEVIDELANMPGFKKAMTNYLKNPVGNGLNEAFQEGSQYVIQESAEEISTKKPTGSIIADWTDAIASNAGKTFTEGEGQESILLGFLIGAITGVGTNIKNYASKSETDEFRKKVIAGLDIENFNMALGKAESIDEVERNALAMMEAYENDDHKAYRDAQFKTIMSLIDMHDQAGTIDMFKEMLDDAVAMEDEQFSKSFGVKLEALGTTENLTKTAIVKSVKDRIDTYLEVKEKVNDAFATFREAPGLPRLLMSKEAKEREEDLSKSNETLRRILLNNSLNLHDTEDRMQSLIDEINKEAGLSGENVLTKKDFRLTGPLFEVEESTEEENETRKITPAPEFSEETTNKLKAIDEELSQKGGLEENSTRRKLRDLKFLAADRFKAASAIKEVMSDPETRSARLALEVIRKNNESIDRIAKDLENKIEQANTLQELKDLADYIKSAPEDKRIQKVIDKYNKAISDKQAAYRAIRRESRSMHLNDIRKELEEFEKKREAGEDYDSLREEAFIAELKKREKKKQEDPIPEKEPKKTPTNPIPEDGKVVGKSKNKKGKMDVIANVYEEETEDGVESNFVTVVSYDGKYTEGEQKGKTRPKVGKIMSFEEYVEEYGDPEQTPPEGFLPVQVKVREERIAEEGGKYKSRADIAITFEDSDGQSRTVEYKGITIKKVLPQATPEPVQPGNETNSTTTKGKKKRGKYQSANGEYLRYNPTKDEEDAERKSQKLVVDKNGNLQPGYDTTAHPEISEDLAAARARLNEISNEELDGAEGYLELIEKNSGNVAGIYYLDELVGIVSKKDYDKSIAELLKSGERVPIRFNGKTSMSYNTTNTLDENGEKVFRPVSEVIDAKAVVGLAFVKKVDTEEGIDLESPQDSDEMVGALNEIIQRHNPNSGNSFILSPGQVILVVRRPDGSYVPMALSTKPLGQERGDRFLGYLRENKLDAMRDLAGITSQNNPRASFMVNEIEGVTVINFKHSALPEGQQISITADNFLALIDESKSLEEIEFKVVRFRKQGGEYIIRTVKGAPIADLTKSIRNEAKSLVYNKLKRQVDIELLENEEDLQTAIEEDLQADFIALPNGYFHFDTGLTFSLDTGSMKAELSESAPSEETKKEDDTTDYEDDPFSDTAGGGMFTNLEYEDDEETVTEAPAELVALLNDKSVSLYQYDSTKEASAQQKDPETGELLTETSESFYWNEKTKKKYKRVTTIANPDVKKDGDGKIITEDPITLQSANLIGTAVDNFVREFFDNDGNVDFSKHNFGTNELYEGLMQQLTKLKESFEEKGETVITKEVVVYNDEMGVAGTLDIVTYDRKGNVRVYDVKTMRTNYMSPKNKNLYEKPFPGATYSNQQKHQRQLSMYSILMGETHGIDVVGGGIIPIKVFYPKKSVVQSVTTEAKLVLGTKHKPVVFLSEVDEYSLGKTPKGLRGLKLGEKATQEIRKKEAVAWLKERFGESSVTLVDQLEMVGNEIVHGYVENSAVYLYARAQAGTQYHEGFHLFFRTLLTEQQRESLYQDALKEFGEPTAEDIAKARRGQDGISDADARLLALEERMADEFMSFMLNEEGMERTLPQKIAKFFKDLWAFVQALVTGKMRMRQAFSLLENNRRPNEILGQMIRSPKAFAPGRAYMINEMGHSPEVYEELMNLMSYMTVVTKENNDDISDTEILGTADGGTRSDIRDWFLAHSFHLKGADRSYIGDDLVDDLIAAYDPLLKAFQEGTITKEKFGSSLVAWMKSNNVAVGVPATMANGKPTPKKAYRNNVPAFQFLEVYNNWFDVEDSFGGIKQTGFRTELGERLKGFGIRVKDETVVDTDSDFERIFSLARMKEDPAKKLTEKARRALSKIPLGSTRNTLYGFQYYVPITDIIHEMQGAVADATSMGKKNKKGAYLDSSMLGILQNKSNKIPYMKEVFEFLENLSAEEKALFYSSMSLSMSNFVAVIVEEDSEGKTIVKMIDPSTIQVDYYLDKWETKAITSKGVYKLLEDGERTVSASRIKKINKLLSKVQSDTQGDNITKKTLEQAAELLWEMGIELAETKKEAKKRMVAAFEDTPGDFSRMFFPTTRTTRKTSADLRRFQEVFKPGQETYKNVFKENRNRIKNIIKKVILPFETPKAASVNSVMGEQYWPLNQKTDLTITRDMLRSGELAAMYDPDEEETVGHAIGEKDSSGRRTLESFGVSLMKSEGYKNIFQPVDLDGMRLKDKLTSRDILTENRTLTFDQSLALRLHAYTNPSGRSGNVMYIAIDTQADRDRLTFIPIPKWDKTDKKLATSFGLKGITTDEFGAALGKDAATGRDLGARNIIKNYVLLDLHRIGRAVVDKAEGENLIDGYHTGENPQFMYLQSGFGIDGKLPKDKLNLASSFHGEIEGGATIEEALEDNPEIGELVDEIINDFFERADSYTEEMVMELGGVENANAFIEENVDFRSLESLNKDEYHTLLADFVLADMIGGLISREIFNGSRNYTKDGADYFKRSSLTTTPGIILMMRGDVSDEYGMQPQFNEGTIKDIEVSLPADQLGRLFNALVDKTGVTRERAAEILSPYGFAGFDPDGNVIVDNSAINTTDAQAFITIHMYRSIMMGMGQWSDEHIEAYKNYKGFWKGPPLIPLKPSYEMRVRHNGHIVPISHKNSYMVLTDELVDEIPTLRMLLDRMELRKDGDGLKANPEWDFTTTSNPGITPIDVMNVESTKKKASFVPVDSLDSQALLTMPVQTLDSRGLKFPQLLPDKTDKSQMTLGRQPRKNMIANIKSDGIYFIDVFDEDGNMTKREVKGSELIRIYQKAVVGKVRINEAKVHKELGYDRWLAAEGNKEKQYEAMKYIIPKFRNKMRDLGFEKEYSQNLLNALELVDFDKTRMPVSFPGYANKLDQLFFGLFRTNVYQQKVLGQEMVQFSEYGPSEKSGDLKFIDVGEDGNVTVAQVDMRTDVLEKMGINPFQSLEEINAELKQVLGYRIPQQSKSSMIILEVRNVLPASYRKAAVRVPIGTTAQMGSDFDVDKLFLMFPEMEGKGKTFRKVQVPYDALTELEDFSSLDEKVLNNIIFDTFRAVGSSVLHLDEILAGVEIASVQEARDSMGAKRILDLNNPNTRIRTGIDNMLSMSLRGIYANAVAGRNVAIASNVEFMSRRGKELRITDSEFGTDATILNRLALSSPFSGFYTDYYLSQFLSAAVDSVKDPLQEQINDNEVTAMMTVYMLSMGMTPKQTVAVLNTKVLRQIVERVRDKSIVSASSLEEALKIELDDIQKTLPEDEQEKFKRTAPMKLDIDFLRSVSRGEAEFTEEQEIEYLKQMYTMAKEARTVDNLYRVITPDAIDKAGTLSQNLARLDVIDKLSEETTKDEDKTFGGLEAMEQITKGDAYPIVRGYIQAIRSSVRFAGVLGFPADQAGIRKFKSTLKEIFGKGQLNEFFHRDINRAILHYLVTQPGSPLFESGLLDSDFVSDNHFNGVLEDQMDELQQIFQEAGIRNMVIDSTNITSVETDEGAKAFVIDFAEVDRIKVSDKFDKDRFTATFLKMYQDPKKIAERLVKKIEESRKKADEYFEDDEDMPTVEEVTNLIKDFTRRLTSNMIISTGFAAGKTSMFELIPIEVFEDMGVPDHLRTEMKKLAEDPNYLTEIGFLDEFIHSYAHTSIRGEPLLDTRRTYAASEFSPVVSKVPFNFPYILSKVQGEGARVYQRTGKSKKRKINTYKLVTRKNSKRGFYEANLRDPETGGKFSGSLIFDNSKGEDNSPVIFKDVVDNDTESSLLSIEDKVTPRTAERTAEKLVQVFGKVGINVKVEFGELPEGTKGQIQGNIITIDPAQVRGDTTYHEFAHIIVDMLPQEEVSKYIQEILRTDPKLAAAVRAKYGNTIKDEFRLGKEILVTAIGREGAKLERKNPSKIQKLINRIIRAIAKFFGMQLNQDVPATAAERIAKLMFEGKLEELDLTGEFNPAVQKSLELEDEIKSITDKLLITLRKRKDALRRAEPTDSRVLEIRTIERHIRNIREGEEQMVSFIALSEYVQTTVARMKKSMADVVSRSEESLDRDESFELLGSISEIKELLDSLYDNVESRSTVVAMQDLLEELDISNEDNIGSEVLRDLDESLRELRKLNNEYSKNVLPLVADVLLTYADVTEAVSPEEIERIRKNMDISGFEIPIRVLGMELTSVKYAPYRKLLQAYRDKKISKEQYREQAVEVKINFLKDRNITHREQLVAELRDAHKDKSGFSFYLDPMTYSNEANLQLFALALKDGINKATEKTRGFLFELEAAYNQFKNAKGGDRNIGRLNEDLLEEIVVYRGGQPIRVLAIVQPYDVDRFYKDRAAMLKEVNELYEVPEDRYSEEYKNWLEKEDEETGLLLSTLRKKAIEQWYKENTEPIEGAEKILDDLIDRIADLEQQIDEIEDQMVDEGSVTGLDKLSLLESELKFLTGKRFSVASKFRSDGSVQYMGSLAQPNSKYKNARYEKLDPESSRFDPELRKYYDFVIDKYKMSQARVGRSQLITNTWEDFSYVMPGFRKSGLDKMQDEGWRDALKEIGRDLKVLDTDTQFGHQAFDIMEHDDETTPMEVEMTRLTGLDGRPLKTIPRYGTNIIESNVTSRDIAASIAQFEHMSNMFEEKGKMLGLVEGMLTAHERRRLLETDGSGIPLVDKTSTMLYNVDKQYINVDSTGSYTMDHLTQFIDSVFYGIADKGENITGKLNSNKIAGMATGITASVNLSFNFLQLGNQLILDTVMGGQEAWSKQFFGMADFGWAQGIYAANGAAMSDAGAFVNKSKLGQAITMFDSMVEVTDNIGRKITGSKLKKFIQDPLFFLQHGIEHQTSTVRMLALMRSYKGKLRDKNGNVLKNDKGQDADVWDILITDEKGMLIVDPRVANFNRERFIAKLHGIHRRANQVKGSFDRAMAQRTAVGKLLLVFRNFIIPGWRKRFGHGEPYHMDYELGDMTRGMYLSALSLIGRTFGRGKFNFLGQFNQMSEIDKQNIRRTLYDMFFYATAMAVYSLTTSAMDDEDDESYSTAFLAYQARRLQAELTQFLAPYEFVRIAASPMATTNLVYKWASFLHQLVGDQLYFMGLSDEEKNVYYQRDTANALKGDRKLGVKFRRIIPAINGFTTAPFIEGSAASVEEKLRWFEKPL